MGGLRRLGLVRFRRAEGHSSGDRQDASRGDRGSHQQPAGRAAPGARGRRAGRQHAGGIRRLHEGGVRSLGHPHQEGRAWSGLKIGSPAVYCPDATHT